VEPRPTMDDRQLLVIRNAPGRRFRILWNVTSGLGTLPCGRSRRLSAEEVSQAVFCSWPAARSLSNTRS
jgi:hypothetical protein